MGGHQYQLDFSGRQGISTDRRCRFERMEPRQMLSASGLSLGGQSASVEPLLPTASGGAQLSTIHGSAMLSADGQCNAGESSTGIFEVLVELLNQTGEVVEQTWTSAQGGFEFSGLLTGVYALQLHAPEGYSAVSAHVGSGGGIAFDASLIGEIFLASGSLLEGYVFCEQNEETLSEQEASESPRIVTHSSLTGGGNVFIPPIDLFAAQKAAFRPESLIVTPRFSSTLATSQPLQEILTTPPAESIFGGSSQKLKSEADVFDAIFGEIFAMLATHQQDEGDLVSEVASYRAEWFDSQADLPGAIDPAGHDPVAHDLVDQVFGAEPPAEGKAERVSARAPSAAQRR